MNHDLDTGACVRTATSEAAGSWHRLVRPAPQTPAYIASFWLLLLVTAPLEAATRYAFTTSQMGSGNLASWPDVAGSGAAGLDAADAICQVRAATAGLPEPESFVAWLSDRQHDAYCRVLGLNGKLAENCGSGTPLPNAGPWLRTDGKPFSESLKAMTEDNVVLMPLVLDEFAQPIGFPYQSFTATTSHGVLNTEFDALPDCGQWMDTQAAETAPFGWSSGTSVAWTDSNGGTSCNIAKRLVCLQTGIGDPLPKSPPRSSRIAFLTAENVTGSLGGLQSADMLCQSWADDAGYSDAGSYKALLASASDAITVSSRFDYDGPWYRPDGVLFAKSFKQIEEGRVEAPLNVDELGQYHGYAVALSGSTIDGDPAGLDCNGWSATTSVANGSVVNWAFAGYNVHNWLSTAQVSCGLHLPPEWPSKLYCLSDGVGLFRDGFDQ